MAQPSPPASSRSPATPSPPPPCTLEPINLDDPAQAAELLRQRVQCGWASTPAHIATWRQRAAAGTKTLFWILLPLAPPPDKQPQQPLRAGHISLDNNNADNDEPTIATFFVQPAHRGRGLGGAAVAAVEAVARARGCAAIALDTLSRRYYEDDEWRARVEPGPARDALRRGRSNEDWYARLGYVKFMEAPKYPDERPGRGDHRFVAAFMRKTLR